MGKPIINKIETRSFVDGSSVYQNDAIIAAEVMGNVELSDVSEPKSSYNITVGPVYYGPRKTAESFVTTNPDDWETPDATILAFQVERTMTVTGLQAVVEEIDLVEDEHELGVRVQYSKTSMLGAFGSGADGDWVTDDDGPNITGVDASGRFPAGELTFEKKYTKGTFIRVRIVNELAGLLAPNFNRPQAHVTVTLTIAEEHVE